MLKDRSPGRSRPCKLRRCARLGTFGAAREGSEEQLFSHGAGRARRILERTTVPSSCGAREALQCSTTARRAAHVRASYDIVLRLGTSAVSAARECARRSGYSVTVSVERVVSLIEGLSHHRVVRGQRFNAHAPLNGPLTPVHKLRDVLVPAPRRGARRRAEEVLNVLRCRSGASTH